VGGHSDELLMMYDWAGSGSGNSLAGRNPWYVLQDADGDNVALVNTRLGGGIVAAEWTYDAYGSVLKSKTLSPHPPLHCGHRSVFIDRLDVGVVGPGQAALGDAPGTQGDYNGTDTRRLVPFATVIGHMRNRVYEPFTGRFLQRDMNASASVVLGSTAHHGQALEAAVSVFDGLQLYGDGGNVYSYLGGSPRGRKDPSGLFLLLPFSQEQLGNAIRYQQAYERGKKAYDVAKQLVS